MSNFRDARLKVDRANKHIRDATEVVRSLVENYTVTVQVDSQTGYQHLVHAAPDLVNACLELSLIAGDALHNLRTALDYAWVATLKKHVSTANLDYAKFPIRDTRKELEDTLNGIHINATTQPKIFEVVMSSVQPYDGGKNGVVYTLHKIDIRDKHLLRLSIEPLAGISDIVVEKGDGETVHGFGPTVQSVGPYVITFDRDIRVKQHGKLSINIVVEDAGIYNHVHVIDLLTKFSQVVLYYIKLLEDM